MVKDYRELEKSVDEATDEMIDMLRKKTTEIMEKFDLEPTESIATVLEISQRLLSNSLFASAKLCIKKDSQEKYIEEVLELIKTKVIKFLEKYKNHH